MRTIDRASAFKRDYKRQAKGQAERLVAELPSEVAKEAAIVTKALADRFAA